LNSLLVSHCATANPLGLGCAATLAALRNRRCGLRHNDFETAEIETWIGRVEGVEDEPVVPRLSDFECRNNRLAQLGLKQDGFEQAVSRARSRYGSDRVAVLMGTSTSGIHETELAYRARDAETGALPATICYRYSHNVFSVADFVRRYLRLQGPAAAISTACSSSAKVFASAHRMIEAELADAAVVGGVDSLCLTTLYGFNSLQLVSRDPCRPCDVARSGISIGEAAGFALLERANESEGAVALLGYGESSDAHHMSSPHPQGEGAYLAMRDALARAGLEPEDIDYVNMHGTATPANDRAEDIALYRIFGNSVACSSTKGWTGHTLGAAGITEAILSSLCLQHGFIPGSLNTTTLDPAFKSRIALSAETHPLRYVLSNSFGFGGSNCSLVLGRGA
jgi:3-oxoacyl-[acyl-carrier-protein] synthase-1